MGRVKQLLVLIPLLFVILLGVACSDDGDEYYFVVGDDEQIIIQSSPDSSPDPDPTPEPNSDLEPPGLHVVLPATLAKGIPNRVSIFGSQLSEYEGLPLQVGSQFISDYEIVSEEEIRLLLPEVNESGQLEVVFPTASNSIEVTMHENTESLPTSMMTGNDLVVPFANMGTKIIYDYGRNRVYIMAESGVAVYSVVGNSWLRQLVPVSQPQAMTMTIDESQLLVTTGNSRMITIDLGSLTTTNDSINHSLEFDIEWGFVTQFYNGEIQVAQTLAPVRNLRTFTYPDMRRTTRHMYAEYLEGKTRNWLHLQEDYSSAFYERTSGNYTSAHTEYFHWDSDEPDYVRYGHRYSWSFSTQKMRTVHNGRIREEGGRRHIDYGIEGPDLSTSDHTVISNDGDLVIQYQHSRKQMVIRGLSGNMVDGNFESFVVGDDILLDGSVSVVKHMIITDDEKYVLIFGDTTTDEQEFFQAIAL